MPTLSPLRLPLPAGDRGDAEAFVAEHFPGLYHQSELHGTGGVRGSDRFRGGQRAADQALARFDVEGYAAGRNEVFPQRERSTSGLSPYIRHGLLSLRDVWDQVEGGPEADVAKFRDELLWQEYARHWYARLGEATRQSLRQDRDLRGRVPLASDETPARPFDAVIEPGMACLELSVEELEDDGWLPNQSRLWLAGHWANRHHRRWQDGEDHLFRRLLDGSRAANRLGWQWAAGTASTQSYRFTRWQVEERAAGLCATCDLVHACPIEGWPSDPAAQPVEQSVELRGTDDPGRASGPSRPVISGEPDVVWLTAESLGNRDPALLAHQHLPAVFVFDRPLLSRLQLTPLRLVFLVETLAELAETRPVVLYLGRPTDALAHSRPAVTYAPVPGFRRRVGPIAPAVLHPWPWLCQPNEGSVLSFSEWLKASVPERRRPLLPPPEADVVPDPFFPLPSSTESTKLGLS